MKKEQVRLKCQAGGKGGGDSRLSPTPKEKILQNFKSTSLEKPTKPKSTKLEKSTEVRIHANVLDGEKSNEHNISAPKPVGGEGWGETQV